MGLSTELSCEAGSFSHCCNPPRFLQSEVLRLYFPMLNPGLCSLSFSPVAPPGLSRRMWHCPLHQPPPCLPWSSNHRLTVSPLCPPGCLSPSLLPVWMKGSSLSPWLLDYHSLIYWQLGLFFVFKFVVVLLLVV